jgi:predicted alpha/beta-fold hydrolase
MTDAERTSIVSNEKLLLATADLLAQKPFRPHPLFISGHAQTLAAYAWPRRWALGSAQDEERFFDVAPATKVLAHCRWQARRREHPTVVIWHGMEGSSSSVYMLGLAKKGFAAGFNVVRMNLRSCGGTEHLTSSFYHGGLTEDLRYAVRTLIEQDGLDRLVLIGYSLGGNLVLKLAGEYGDQMPAQVRGVCAVSPSVDLNASTETICRPSNWIYHRDFLRRLRKRLKATRKWNSELVDLNQLKLVRTIRDFDDHFTSRAHGFAGADDYYHRASSLRVIDKIRIPTLIIHAKDDPFIPFAPLLDEALLGNPNILLAATKNGGHVAFLAAGDARIRNHSPASSHHLEREDRFWAENRAIDFASLATAQR